MAMLTCLNQGDFATIHDGVMALARAQVEEGGSAVPMLHTFRVANHVVHNVGGLALEIVPADWSAGEIGTLLHSQLQLPYVDAAAFSATAWALDLAPILADLAGILEALSARAASPGGPLAALVASWQRRACSEPATVAGELGRILVQEAGGVGNLPAALRRESLVITVAAADRDYCWLHGIEQVPARRLAEIPWHDPFAAGAASPTPFSLATTGQSHL